LLFAPTEEAAANLQGELVPDERIFVTGNTGVDAMQEIRQALREGRLPRTLWPYPGPRRRLLLVTVHRRESFGTGLRGICRGLLAVAQRPDVEIVFPVHPNPQVAETVRALLAGRSNIHL